MQLWCLVSTHKQGGHKHLWHGNYSTSVCYPPFSAQFFIRVHVLLDIVSHSISVHDANVIRSLTACEEFRINMHPVTASNALAIQQYLKTHSVDDLEEGLVWYGYKSLLGTVEEISHLWLRNVEDLKPAIRNFSWNTACGRKCLREYGHGSTNVLRIGSSIQMSCNFSAKELCAYPVQQ